MIIIIKKIIIIIVVVLKEQFQHSSIQLFLITVQAKSGDLFTALER